MATSIVTSDEYFITLNDFLKKTEYENKYENEKIEPKVIQVNYPKHPNDLIFIYDDFELIEKNTIQLFIDNYMRTSDYFSCYLSEGKIIIDYDNKFENKKYISVIGQLDNDYTFIKEYFLIFEDYYSKSSHMSIINNDILNYLNSLNKKVI